MEFKVKADPKRIRDFGRDIWKYTFVLDGKDNQLPWKPDDEIQAELDLLDGKRLTWMVSRTKRYQFESLSRPPYLHDATRLPRTGNPQARIVLRVGSPAGGVPAIPDLLPGAQ